MAAPRARLRAANRRLARHDPRRPGRQSHPTKRSSLIFKTDGVIGVLPEAGCSYRDVGTWSVLNGHRHREGAAMNHYAGLDVSLEETAICVVDSTGQIVKEARAASEPETLIAALREIDLPLERVGL